MTQPFFADLGKNCNGLFGGGYVHNFVKVDVKCKTDSDVAFSIGSSHNLTSKGTTGNLEARYKFKEQNLTFAEKWNTSNILGSEVTVEDYLTKNTKFSGELAMQPEKKPPPEPTDGGGGSAQVSEGPIVVITKMFRAKGAYKNELGTANIEGEVNSKGGPYLKCAGTIGREHFTTGFGVGYDIKGEMFTERKIGCQLKPNASDDLAFCLWYNLNDSALITSGYYKQEMIEGGFTAQWSFSKSELSLGLGTKYKMNDDTTLRAKIDEKAGLAFGFTRTMKKGFNITLSAMVNCLAPLSGTFQLGGAFEIDL